MMYKMVVFDLDGTVCDTLKDLANSVNMSLEENGLQTYDIEEYRMFVGNGVDNLIKTVMGDKKDDELLFQKIKNAFRDNYSVHLLDYTSEYPGLKDLFRKLEYDGILFGIISNKPDQFVPRIMSAVYPDISFPFAIGKKDEYPRKPEPESLISYIEKYKMERKDVLYVGDSNVDVVYAHNAGVKVCSVTWGFREEEELVSAGAEYIAHDTEELIEVIYGKSEH